MAQTLVIQVPVEGRRGLRSGVGASLLRVGSLLWALGLPSFAQAATPSVDDLAKPPAEAHRYTLLSKAAPHGHAELWTLPDGTTMERDSLQLRGEVTEIESASRLGADGMLALLAIRGFTPSGDAAETFSAAHGIAQWTSRVDHGSRPYAAPAWYVAEGGAFAAPDFIQALLRSPTHSLALLPGGQARVRELARTQVGDGARRVALVCWSIEGVGPSPAPVWTTPDGNFWGVAGEIALLPVGYEGALGELDRVQDAALAARSPVIAHTLPTKPAGPVAIAHVRAFVDGTHFAEDQTIVVDHGVISAAGPAASVVVPAGAQTISGAGRTLVPGLWDSHQHVGDDSSGPFLLALGITSVRDPGNDDEQTISRAQRRAAGDLLMPHVYPSALIDGKGPYTAQVADVATSLDEAIGWVRRAKANGFTGVKFYGSLDPAWVAPAAAEAHRLGLHVHGHVPAGMRPSDAIRAGYDEITHINFVIMEAMPDAVVQTSNGSGRLVGVGRYARLVDLDAEPMRSLVASMKARHIASDPTLSTFEALYVPDNGDLSPAYAPYRGTMPPAIERGFLEGGLVPPEGLTRADVRASYAKLAELVGVLHRAGIRIVAGTDGTGLELVRELELYVQAGFTPAQALASATIEAARNVGVDARTGAIAPGQVADLVLVDGDPSKHIGDLRNTRVVIMDGQVMDADALRDAASFSGRPHSAL